MGQRGQAWIAGRAEEMDPAQAEYLKKFHGVKSKWGRENCRLMSLNLHQSQLRPCGGRLDYRNEGLRNGVDASFDRYKPLIWESRHYQNLNIIN